MNYIYGKDRLFRTASAGVILTAVLLTGCGNRAEIFLRGAGMTAEAEDTGPDTSETETAEVTPDADMSRVASETPERKMIYVDLCGAVKRPGVYCVPEGSRLFEVIETAGGLRGDACEAAINRACIVSDGQKIVVPTLDEIQEAGQSPVELTSGNTKDGKINLNTAASEELMTLPGIGLSKAEAIIRYREENGPFQSAEDLMKVGGIKQATYDRIRDHITVN